MYMVRGIIARIGHNKTKDNKDTHLAVVGPISCVRIRYFFTAACPVVSATKAS